MSPERSSSLRIIAAIAIAAIPSFSCSSSNSSTTPAEQDYISITGPKSGYINQPDTFKINTNITLNPGDGFGWTFDSASTQSTVPEKVWTFQTAGQHLIQASLLHNRTLLTSPIDTFISSLRPVDTSSILASFHHFKISFIGDHNFSTPNWGDNILCAPWGHWRNIFFADTMTFDKSYFRIGELTTNYQQLNSMDYKVHLEARGIQGYCDINKYAYCNCNGDASISLSELPIVYFNVDSLKYGLSGPEVLNHIHFEARDSGVYWDDCQPGIKSYFDIKYIGTNWNSVVVKPELTVTFYK